MSENTRSNETEDPKPDLPPCTWEDLRKWRDSLPRETLREMEFRRGYYEGFLAAIDDFCYSRPRFEKTYQALYRFACTELRGWMQAARTGDPVSITPPPQPSPPQDR